MHGNYDSYGTVFDGMGGSFKWNIKDLDTTMLLDDEWSEEEPFPTTISDLDPDQGWGYDFEYFSTGKSDKFEQIENPKHVIIEETFRSAKIYIIVKKLKLLKEEKDGIKDYIKSLSNECKKKYDKMIEDLNCRIIELECELNEINK